MGRERQVNVGQWVCNTNKNAVQAAAKVILSCKPRRMWFFLLLCAVGLQGGQHISTTFLQISSQLCQIWYVTQPEKPEKNSTHFSICINYSDCSQIRTSGENVFRSPADRPARLLWQALLVHWVQMCCLLLCMPLESEVSTLSGAANCAHLPANSLSQNVL